MSKHAKNKTEWNATLYDGNHSFVSQYGENLIDILAPREGEYVLDVGCGTGDLTNSLARHGVTVVAIDASDTMIQFAKTKYPELEFQVKDVLHLDYHSIFDAIFSNATLHWVKPPKQALQAIFSSLKKGGRFVAEFGGVGNVQLITDELWRQFNKVIPSQTIPFPWYFPSIGEYTSLMEEVGFHVTYAYHFDRPTPLQGKDGLRNWITMFCDSLLRQVSDTSKEEIINGVESSLKETSLYHNGTWYADYKRIQVVGIKD